ncbi:FtsX-like permease family protein [Capnocytophaga gingivalis]|uniref:FtsX-like permease family protein n=1 Tax=Capnocytophaga gingivalis TaxID=1017 RepID=A0ABU5Z7K6_9FLAO|nr:FtsX-like permease family protein [Capnocytophaga gingivalis]MEB3074935.1 FtsX-like permease family protein [Capnocytophaga gingivalis]
MKAIFFIAWRYVRSKSSQNVINIINRMSIFVLIVGGASLMIVLAGFSGLRTFSMSFSNFFDPDLKVFPKTGKTFSLSPIQETALKESGVVASYTKVLEERVFLNSRGKNYIAYIKGVDENYPKVNAVDSILVISPKEWLLSEDYVVVGNIIAETLNLGLFTSTTPLQIIVPKAGKGSITSSSTPYREETVLLSDYYQVTEDLDSKYVFATLSLAQRLTGVQANEVSAVEVKLSKGISATEGKKRLQKVLGDSFVIKDRMALNEDLYKMFQTENLATYLIFTLVLIVALFNLVGAIIMMILDKRKNLYTLFALGMTQRQIRAIFFLQGVIVSLLGAVFGVGLGIGIAWLQKTYPMLYINPNATVPIAYPMDIRLLEIVVVFFTIFVLGILASAIGASRTKIND